jgi:UDP-N-acetylglucosamine--N-acetylmuramyl-(pentapeptide) pyrophosphoryl-undecaprenol N-acetylglucosamine transferase
VIAGGGTGGHVYPGVAVAQELRRRRPDAAISFAGTAKGLEAQIVPREGFPLDVIRSAGIKGKRLGDRLRGAWLVPLGLLDAWRLLSVRRPHVVIGVGGYSSGPVVLAAALRRVPTMVLEQNAVPGLTNRWLSRVVDLAAVTYPETARFFGTKAFVSGNPVRPEFTSTGDARAGAGAREGGRVGILIFGGSQGAHAINVAMVAAAPELARSGAALHVVHQTGERDLELVRAAYRESTLDAEVAPFFYDMGRRIGEADVMVCRAGATTLAELEAAGKPAILIPLPTATDDHQRLNAEALVRAGAAEMVLERDLSGPVLAKRVIALAADAEARRRLGAAARGLARPDAAAVIAGRVLELADLKVRPTSGREGRPASGPEGGPAAE